MRMNELTFGFLRQKASGHVKLIIAVCTGLILFSCTANTAEPDSSELDVPPVVQQYFESLDRIQRTGSTIEDIDQLFTLVNDNVRYVHKNFDAEFNRTTWYAAFQRNLLNGRYQQETSFCSSLTNMIPGNGYVAVEYVYGNLTAGKCVPKDDDRRLAIIKIEDDKISLVEELW